MKEETGFPEEKKLGPQFADLMIDKAPQYANRIFYSLGFLAAVSFIMLVISGVVELFFGSTWWLTNPVGVFFRSVHLWSSQAFVIFMLLHLIVVFCTMGYRGPRKITWVIGALMFMTAITETEFGYALRGDFSTQWRALQGADFFNGSGLGWWINPLNTVNIIGMHVAIVPFIIFALLSLHYILVRFLGLATPPKADHPYKIEKANHTMLFLRGGVVAVVILILAVLLPSPYVKVVTLKEVASTDPNLFATTLVGEFGRLQQIGTGDNAQTLTTGYSDNIDPYTWNTRKVYIDGPWASLTATGQVPNLLAPIEKMTPAQQKQLINDAIDFFGDNKGKVTEAQDPLITVVKDLTKMAATGYYDKALRGEGELGDETYALRLMADLGVLDSYAHKMGIKTSQMGMLKEEKPDMNLPGGRAEWQPAFADPSKIPPIKLARPVPPGAWWLAPIGIMDGTILKTDDNGDRDGAYILGLLGLILLAIPFIPGVNRLPVVLGLYKFFQKKPKEDK
ncbi:MAG: hypothetical protein HKM05_09350 [Spirochaetales bacterium]|nr:hypothetical protein [Spirochaetales bacterium]